MASMMPGAGKQAPVNVRFRASRAVATLGRLQGPVDAGDQALVPIGLAHEADGSGLHGPGPHAVLGITGDENHRNAMPAGNEAEMASALSQLHTAAKGRFQFVTKSRNAMLRFREAA